RSLGSTSLTTLSSDYKTPRATTSQLPLGHTNNTNNTNGGNNINGANGTNTTNNSNTTQLDLYEPVGAYAYSNNAEADRYARLDAQAIEAKRDTWLSCSTLRALRSVICLDQQDAPNHLIHPASPSHELLITKTLHIGINSRPGTVPVAITPRL